MEEEEEAGFGRLEPAAIVGVMHAGRKGKARASFFFFLPSPTFRALSSTSYGWNLAVKSAGLIWAAECTGPGTAKEQNIESKFGWQVNNLQSIFCVPIASRHFLF